MCECENTVWRRFRKNRRDPVHVRHNKQVQTAFVHKHIICVIYSEVNRLGSAIKAPEQNVISGRNDVRKNRRLKKIPLYIPNLDE